MPADADPEPTGGHDLVVVQTESNDRCPPGWGQADDVKTVPGPDEVFGPGLLARIEEKCKFARARIECINLGALELIASATGKPEVFLIRRTATGRGDDVFDSEGLPDDFGRRATITTTRSGLFQETGVQ